MSILYRYIYIYIEYSLHIVAIWFFNTERERLLARSLYLHIHNHLLSSSSVLFFEEHNVSKIVLVLVARTHARHTRAHNAYIYIYITRARARPSVRWLPFEQGFKCPSHIYYRICMLEQKRKVQSLFVYVCACVETRARALTQKITMSCREAAVGDGRSRNTTDGDSLFRLRYIKIYI